MNPAIRGRISPASFAAILVLGLGVAQGIMLIYATAAVSGDLGLDAKEKFEAQSAGGVNPLLGGRSEIIVSSQAIIDSPIIGHGSWAHDVTYVSLLVDKMEDLGVQVEGDAFASDLIPTHSHLFGSWVEAGIGGGVFWIVALGFAISALYRTLKLDNVPTSLLAFVSIWMIWDIVFSPFGQEERVLMAARLAIALWVLGQPVRPKLAASRSR
jgi:O-antigen ligase